MDIKVPVVSMPTAPMALLIATRPPPQRMHTASRQKLENGEDRPGKKEGVIAPRNPQTHLQQVIASPLGIIHQQPQEQEQLQLHHHHPHHPSLTTTIVGAAVNNITADNDNTPQVAGTKITRRDRMLMQRGSARKRKELNVQEEEAETEAAVMEAERRMTAHDHRIRERRTGKEGGPRMSTIHPLKAPPDNNSQTRTIRARTNPTRVGTTGTNRHNQRISNTHLPIQRQYPSPVLCPNQTPTAFCRSQGEWAI